MRITFDAYWWIRGSQSMKNVMRGIIETWSDDFPHDQLEIVVPHKHRDMVGSLPANIVVRSTRLWPQALAAMFAVPWNATKHRSDAIVVHSFSALFGRRRSLFLHDAMYQTNPEWFTKKELLYYRWMARLARRAHVVFTTSQTEAARVERCTSARRVVAVGIGVGSDLVDVHDEAVSDLRPGQFVLVVGRVNVRKNLEFTLEGARRSGVIDSNSPLVIVGEPDGAQEKLPPWVADWVRSGAARFTGFVSSAKSAG